MIKCKFFLGEKYMMLMMQLCFITNMGYYIQPA